MKQEIRHKLDHIINTLRVDIMSDPVTDIEQLSYLIYLKLLDEEESKQELGAVSMVGHAAAPLFPKQAQRYRWSRWQAKHGHDLLDFIQDEVFPYMASLVKEQPSVAEYFRDAVLEIRDPNVLKQVVDEIDRIDFRQLGTDIKGDMFEYLLTRLGESALNGQFRTPRQLRTMMVEMVDPSLADTILDPAAGTGGFLIDAVQYILAKSSTQPKEVPIYGEQWLEQRQQTIEQAKTDLPTLQTYRKRADDQVFDLHLNSLEKQIYGFETSRQMVRICMMNLVLHGISHAQVKRANSLSELGGLNEDDLRRKYSVILSTPLFTGTIPKGSIRRDLLINSKKSELLFLALIMQSLVPGGRCAVIVPEGLLFGSTKAHVTLRKKLVEEYDLQAVVSLPAGVFKPYTGIKTSVLLFRRPIIEQKEKNIQDTAKIWFYHVRADGYDPDKISGGARTETPQRNDIPDLLQQWEVYKRSGFKNPPGVETRTHLDAGTQEPRCWWASVKTVAENNYKLAAGRYKPKVMQKRPDEDPIELIREVLAIEKEICEGLEELLREVEVVG